MSISHEHLCPICFDAFQERQATLSHRPEGSRVTAAAAEALEEGAASRPDEHKFHQDCLVTWLRSSFHCPVCRAAGDVFGVQRALPQNREESIINASLQGDSAVVVRLVQQGEISELVRRCALIATCQSEEPNLVIVEALLESGPIMEHIRGWALLEMASRGHTQIAQALLESSPLPLVWHRQAFDAALRAGHLGALKALIASRSISLQERASAIKEAYQRGHYSIIAELAYVKPMIAGALAAAAMAYISSLSKQEDT